MRYIKKFSIFESVAKKVKTLFASKYPYANKEFKYESKYFFTRGLEGSFDIEEGDKDFICYRSPDASAPIVVFHLFFIKTDGFIFYQWAHPGKIMSVDVNEDPDALDEDLESFKKYAAYLGLSLSQKEIDLITDKGSIVSSSSTDYSSSTNRKKYYYDRIGIIKDLNTKAKKASTASNASSVFSMEDIKKTDGYLELINFGVNDDTTEKVWKNGNMRFTHPILKYEAGWSAIKDGQDTLTLHANGPVRGTSQGRPHIIASAPSFEIHTLEDWNNKIKWAVGYFKRRIAKDVFGITTGLPAIGNLGNKEYYESMLSTNPVKFFEYIESLPEEDMNKIFDLGFSLADFIESNPSKAAIVLKKHYKHPTVKDALDQINPEIGKEFKDNLTLTGNLGELGF